MFILNRIISKWIILNTRSNLLDNDNISIRTQWDVFSCWYNSIYRHIDNHPILGNGMISEGNIILRTHIMFPFGQIGTFSVASIILRT